MVKESPRGGVRVAGGAPPSQSHPLKLLDSQRAKLAHDINNPLAIATTNLDFALAELQAGRAGEELHAAIRGARVAVDRISSVVAEAFAAPPKQPDEPPISSVVTAFDEPEPGSETLARTARVLVVDDEPSLGAAIRRSLRDYDVVVTVSGREALEQLASSERFDFILCYLTMPGMGGDELYAEIQRVAPEQVECIVFITGGATTQRAREFIASVPNPVIEKPFDVNKLREMIRRRTMTPERQRR